MVMHNYLSLSAFSKVWVTNPNLCNGPVTKAVKKWHFTTRWPYACHDKKCLLLMCMCLDCMLTCIFGWFIILTYHLFSCGETRNTQFHCFINASSIRIKMHYGNVYGRVANGILWYGKGWLNPTIQPWIGNHFNHWPSVPFCVLIWVILNYRNSH